MIGDEVPTLARDLALIGYPLVASCEVCRCAVCSALDQRQKTITAQHVQAAIDQLPWIGKTMF
jgi:hypothetical protein